MSYENEGRASSLTPELWFGRIAVLENRLSKNSASLEACLRHAFHLTLLAPRPLDAIISNELEEAEFERMMELEDFLEAVVQITGSPYFQTSINIPDGHAVVRVTSRIFNVGREATAKSPAVAILLAWLRTLRAIEDAAEFQSSRPTGSVLSKLQSELRRRSIEL